MGKKVFNHPPTPAVEAPTDPGVVVDDCETLKTKYGLNVATYAEHEEPKSRENNSHHILQDAAVSEYISKAAGLCVLLANAHSGTAHQVTTARQNERRDNKQHGRGGAQPAKNLGELKGLSKGDLEASFKSMNIPDEDAKALAECLVNEAEQKVKKSAKEDTDEDVDDQSPVRQPGGCFPAETLVWLDHLIRRRVNRVATGDAVEGRSGSRPVVRRDQCRSDLVRLWIGRSAVSLAPFHRVLKADGRFERADSLRKGSIVATHQGWARVERTQHDPVPRRIHSICMSERFECRVGRAGLWVLLAHTGAAVVRTVRLQRFRPTARQEPS